MKKRKFYLLLVFAWIVVGKINLAFSQITSPNDPIPPRDSVKIHPNIEDMLQIKSEDTEPVVFSVARQDQKISDAPATIYLITAQEIQVRGYLSLKNILQDIPEYKFDDNSDYTTLNTATVRGVRGNEKFIIMLDGIRISSPTNEQLPILENYPVRNIKQIEIITSASSAIYGADALSGIINIISYKPEEIKGFKIGVYAGLYNYYSTDVLWAKKFKKIQFRLSGQFMYDGQPKLPDFYKIDEYKDMNSLRTGVFNTTFGVKKVITPIDSVYGASIHNYNFEAACIYQNFTLSIHQNYASIPNFMVNTSNNAIYNDNIDLNTRITKASIAHNKSFKQLSNTTIMSYSNYELLPNSNYRNVHSDLEPGYKYSYGSLFQLDQQNTYNINKKISIGMGACAQIFNSVPRGDDLQLIVNPNTGLKSTVRGAPIEVNFTFLRYYNFGGYGQLIYKPTQKWIFIAGLRYDNNSRFSGVWNPRIGVTYKVTPTASIKLFTGSAFLAPSPFVSLQRFGSFFSTDNGATYQSAFYNIPNPNLKPIRSNSLELSYYQSVGGLKLNASVHYIWLSDLYINKVFQDSLIKVYGWPVSTFQQTINQGTGRNYGFSINTQYKLNFSKNKYTNIYAAIAFIDGKDDNTLDSKSNESVQIPYISNWQFRLGTDFILNSFSFSIRMIGMTEQRTLKVVKSIESGKERDLRQVIPGYLTINANFSYQVSKSARFSVLIENLTDQRYRNVNTSAGIEPTEMIGTPQNPIRVILGAQFKL